MGSGVIEAVFDSFPDDFPNIVIRALFIDPPGIGLFFSVGKASPIAMIFASQHGK